MNLNKFSTWILKLIKDKQYKIIVYIDLESIIKIMRILNIYL